jgi:hypothetical protein
LAHQTRLELYTTSARFTRASRAKLQPIWLLMDDRGRGIIGQLVDLRSLHSPPPVFCAKIFYFFDFSELTAYIFLRVKLVGAMLLNQFIVQTEDQNRWSPLPDKKRLMVSI